MAAKERKEHKRGGKKSPASEKFLTLRAVPSSLPEGVQWQKSLGFLRSLSSLRPSSLPVRTPPSSSQQWQRAPAAGGPVQLDTSGLGQPKGYQSVATPGCGMRPLRWRGDFWLKADS